MGRFSIWPWRRGAHEPKQRSREEVEARVYKLLRSEFEVKGLVLGPMTDLVEVTERDSEPLEWAIEALGKEFDMICPKVPDKKGRMRRARLFLPDHLTVSELIDIIARGVWPEDWTREGEWLWDVFGR